MKKTYMQPQIVVVTTAQTLLIGTSTPIDKTGNNGLNSGDNLTKPRGEWDKWGNGN